jgi:hypothetical protein
MVEARGSEKCSCKKIVIDRDTTEGKYKKNRKSFDGNCLHYST